MARRTLVAVRSSWPCQRSPSTWPTTLRRRTPPPRRCAQAVSSWSRAISRCPPTRPSSRPRGRRRRRPSPPPAAGSCCRAPARTRACPRRPSSPPPPSSARSPASRLLLPRSPDGVPCARRHRRRHEALAVPGGSASKTPSLIRSSTTAWAAIASRRPGTICAPQDAERRKVTTIPPMRVTLGLSHLHMHGMMRSLLLLMPFPIQTSGTLQPQLQVRRRRRAPFCCC